MHVWLGVEGWGLGPPGLRMFSWASLGLHGAEPFMDSNLYIYEPSRYELKNVARSGWAMRNRLDCLRMWFKSEIVLYHKC